MNRFAGASLRRRMAVAAFAAAVATASVAAAAKRSLEAFASVAGVRLGPATFDDARRLLGPFACWAGCRGGSPGADEYQLARSVGRIEFGANGHQPAPGFDPRCARTGRLSAATPVGSLRLGMTRGEVVGALGAPEREASGRLEYADGKFHLAVTIADGRVVAVGGAIWWE